MGTRLITMLTDNDRTVADALTVFNDCKDLDSQLWGFKDLGLSKNGMKELMGAMKQADKKTFLEVVSYSEKECMRGAELAAELEFDYLMGTLFHESVWNFVKEQKFIYLPFVGHVHSSPSVLEGNIGDIIDEGNKLVNKGIQGFDLLAYRHVLAAESLARKFVGTMDVPVIIAGSVDTVEKINFIHNIGAWAYTIGGAFFSKKFVPDGSFRDNMAFVINYMNKQ